MFRDRADAAGRLARALKHFRGRPDLLVLAVPRGGLPVGALLARELGAGLDVVLTKKIGHPHNPEFAIGAVSLTGAEVDLDVLRREGVDPNYAVREAERLREVLRERYRLYRGDAKPPEVRGRTVILTDDGVATGRTLAAAVSWLREEGAARVVVAVPVGPPDAVARLREIADEVVCLETPDDFMAIGQYYRDFDQVPDEEAVALLRGAARR